MAARFFGGRGRKTDGEYDVTRILWSREEDLKRQVASTCQRKIEHPKYDRLWRWATCPEGAVLLERMINNVRYLLGNTSTTDKASNEFVVTLLVKACSQFHLFALLVGFRFVQFPQQMPLRNVQQAFKEFESAWERQKFAFNGESSFKALGAAIGVTPGRSFKELRDLGLGALVKPDKPGYFLSVDDEATLMWAREKVAPGESPELFALPYDGPSFKLFERVLPENLLTTLLDHVIVHERKLEVLEIVESGHIRHLQQLREISRQPSLLLELGRPLGVNRLVRLVNILYNKHALDSHHVEDFVISAMDTRDPWYEGVEKLLESAPFQDHQNLHAQKIPPMILQLLAPSVLEEEAEAVYENSLLKDNYVGALSFSQTDMEQRRTPLPPRNQARPAREIVQNLTKTVSRTLNKVGGTLTGRRSVGDRASSSETKSSGGASFLDEGVVEAQAFSFEDVYSLWKQNALPNIRSLLLQLFSLLDVPSMFDALLKHISDAPILSDALLSLAFGQPWVHNRGAYEATGLSYVQSSFSPQLLDNEEMRNKLVGLLAAAARLKNHNPYSTVLPQLATTLQTSVFAIQESAPEKWEIILKGLCSPNVDQGSRQLLDKVFVVPEAFYGAVVDVAAVRQEGQPKHFLYNSRPTLYTKLLALFVRCQTRNARSFAEASQVMLHAGMGFSTLACKVFQSVDHAKVFLEGFLDILLARPLADFYTGGGTLPELDMEKFLRGIDVGADLLSTMNDQTARRILETMYWHVARTESVKNLPSKLMSSVTNSKLINNIQRESFEAAWEAFQNENVPAGRLTEDFLGSVREKYPVPLITLDKLLPLITSESDSFREDCANALQEFESPEMTLLRDAAIEWMCISKRNIGVAIKPHHTQIISCLVSYEMFRSGQRTISLMRTGEGKSLVLAFFALMVYKLVNQRVLIIANNGSLRDRDMESFLDLFEAFNVTASNDISKEDAQVIYCTLDDIQYHHFHQVTKKQTIPLENVVAVLDECDQLLVDRPSFDMHVVPSTEVSEQEVLAMFEAARDSAPNPVPSRSEVFADIEAAFHEAALKLPVKDYTFSQHDQRFFMMNNGVMETDAWALWLEALNFREGHTKPIHMRACYAASAVHILKSFDYICGFTGSIGREGEASGRTPEERYVREAFQMQVIYTPRFLSTCVPLSRLSGATLTKVRIYSEREKAFQAILRDAKVISNTRPVLVILPTEADATDFHQKLVGGNFDRAQLFLPRGTIMTNMNPEQLTQMVRNAAEPVETVEYASTNASASASASGSASASASASTNAPSSAQFLPGFGSKSKSSGASTTRSIRWRITCTSREGARGHDYPSHPRADREGGMHIIAGGFAHSSREWIQWIGRTARMGAQGDVQVMAWRDHFSVPTEKPGQDPDEYFKYVLQVADIPFPASESEYPIKAENAKATALTEAHLNALDDTTNAKLQKKLPSLEVGVALNRLCDLIHVRHSDNSGMKAMLQQMLQDKSITVDIINSSIAQIENL